VQHPQRIVGLLDGPDRFGSLSGRVLPAAEIARR
jgi:hypothetical protein